MTEHPDQTQTELHQRIEMLELENAHLRKHVAAFIGEPRPGFDIMAFQTALRFYTMMAMLPAFLLFTVTFLPRGSLPVLYVAEGIPLLDVAGHASGYPGLGLGLIAFGGLAVGGLAVGGGAVGVIAVGGGSIGLVAIGGGSLGVVAVGGGACGVIAVAGGGLGYYLLAGGGRGRYCLTLKRQDPEAVALFTRYLPRLKRAFTGPLPVIPVEQMR